MHALVRLLYTWNFNCLKACHSKGKSYLLFLNVPDLVFEADKPIINVSLVRLGRRGRRVERSLQGAGGRLALPRRVHLLLGRLHALLLPVLWPAWRWRWAAERGLGKLHHWNGWSCKETPLAGRSLPQSHPFAAGPPPFPPPIPTFRLPYPI